MNYEELINLQCNETNAMTAPELYQPCCPGPGYITTDWGGEGACFYHAPKLHLEIDTRS